MSEKNKVLLVDDEDDIRGPLADYLRSNGFHVRDAADAQEARDLLAVHPFDILVLDVMMPGEDGLSLCRHVREKYDLPVVMLTAKGEDTDRIIGLEIGADDYVSKPFNPRELLARLKAVLRRSLAPPRMQENTHALAFGDWVLRLDERVLMDRDGVSTALSTGEYNLLHAMLVRPRMVLSREQLLELSRGRESHVFDRSIDNMVSRVRRKIETDPKNPEILKTVWGGGYILAADVKPE
ncbi:MAG: response regulator [Pseudomonadota bacterium]